MSFLEELKRRNVFRVGIAYVALGWVMIEVTDTVAPVLGMPEWTLTVVTWFGIIGLPFALLFAWAFELTPEGLKREHEVDRTQSTTHLTGRKLDFVIIGLLVAAVVFLVADNYLLDEVVETAEVPVTQSSTAAQVDQSYDSIAVLPFENLSDDPEQGYFSDGLAEELLNTFARNRSLKVVARTSSFAFKGQQVDIREIGEALEVATILEGSVQKSGNRVRITAQLIDVSSGYHLWSETYDRELVDVFEVQDEIAGRIESALKVHLESASGTRVTKTTDAQAYDAYLRGRQGLHQRTRSSIESAQRSFEFATARDPEFALAWAALAQARYLLSQRQYGTTEPKESNANAQALIDRALALDAELAEAHAVQALLYMDDGRYTDAVASLDHAIAINPGVAEFYHWRSNALFTMGKYGDRQEALLRALSLDPFHPVALVSRAMGACALGLEPVAEDLLMPLDRYPLRAATSRASCLMANGRLAQAYQLLSETDDPITESWRSFVLLTLKDCELPLLVSPLTPDENLILQKMYCNDEDAAIKIYQAMPLDERVNNEALKLFSLLQLRMGDYSGMLKTLEPLHADQDFGITIERSVFDANNLALNRSFALLQLGNQAEAQRLLRGVRIAIDQAKQEGVKRNHRVLEAKLLLLEGDHQRAADSLNAALEGFEIDWVDLADPVFHELLEPDKLSGITARLDQHINAERAKLGWPPANF